MRQFELFAIITQPIALMSVVLSVHLIPRQASQRLSIARVSTSAVTEIRPLTGFEPSPNQHLPAGSKHMIYLPRNQLSYH